MNEFKGGERAAGAGPQGGEMLGATQPGFDGKGIPMHSRDSHDIPVMSRPATIHIPRHQFTEMAIQHGRPPGEFAGLMGGQGPRDGRWQLLNVAGASWVLPQSMVCGSSPADCVRRKTRGGDDGCNSKSRSLFGSITQLLYAFFCRHATGFAMGPMIR